MEINPVSAREQRRLDQKKAGRAPSSSGPAFDAALQEATAVETEGSVEALMDDLREQERRFLDLQNLVELTKYKQKLQRILKLLISDSFQATTFTRARKGNVSREPFLIIKQINAKVDELAVALLSPDNKAFALMRTIEEIRGLILDLIH